FIDGPRVMANMAVDSYLPHRFSQLSDRLTMSYGVLLIGGASLLALLLHGRGRDALGRPVFHQRVSDVLPVGAGDVPVLGAGAEEAFDVADAHLGPRVRPHAVSVHSHSDGVREVRRGWVGDARADRGTHRVRVRDEPPLSARF